MQPLKFAGSTSPFFTELKEQVNQYFSSSKKRSTGNLYLFNQLQTNIYW